MTHVSGPEFGKLLIHNGGQEFQGDKPLDLDPHLSLGEWGVQGTQAPDTTPDWRNHMTDLTEIRRQLGSATGRAVSRDMVPKQSLPKDRLNHMMPVSNIRWAVKAWMAREAREARQIGQ